MKLLEKLLMSLLKEEVLVGIDLKGFENCLYSRKL